MLPQPLRNLAPSLFERDPNSAGTFLRRVASELTEPAPVIDYGYGPAFPHDRAGSDGDLALARHVFHLLRLGFEDAPTIPPRDHDALARIAREVSWRWTGSRLPISWLMLGAHASLVAFAVPATDTDLECLHRWYHEQFLPAHPRFAFAWPPGASAEATLPSPPAHVASDPARLLARDALVWAGLGGNAPTYMLKGDWHASEPDRTWSTGADALLAFSADGWDGAFGLDVDLALPSARKAPSWTLTVTCQRRRVFTGSWAEWRRLLLPAIGTAERDRLVLIGFHLDRPFRPAEHGAADARTLGVGLKRFWVRPLD